MTSDQTTRINYYNIAAMLAAACLAVVIPFELVLLSYAILGPGHYLTEISWLNGRQFFTPKKYDILLIIGAAVLVFALKLPYGYGIFYVFGLAFVLLVANNWLYRVLAFAVIVAGGYFLLSNNILQTIFGLYVPTLIHVYFFTGAFMLFGALKDKNVSGYIAFVLFLACPVILCFILPGWHNSVSSWAISNYGDFGRLNTTTLKNQHLDIFSNPASIILTRIIAFAYTYHYLNWFSKTRVINWHKMTVKRSIVIGIIWVASVALYFYNYRVGIKWLFMLSLAHVILEFPLNHRSFIGIGKELGVRLKKL